MEFKSTPLFKDIIKEHSIDKNILLPAKIMNYLESILASGNYKEILDGLKTLHDNKDIYYLDPNNIIVSRICSVLFHLLYFNPVEHISKITTESIRIVYNNHITHHIELKESYDVSYNEKNIITYLKFRTKEIELLKNIFIFIVPSPEVKKIKIAWL